LIWHAQTPGPVYQYAKWLISQCRIQPFCFAFAKQGQLIALNLN
jgi:hypothetical protein